MSHLISLFYGKPSLHLSILRSRGLELDRLFEVVETRIPPVASAAAEQGVLVEAEDRITALKAARSRDTLNPKQFDELCLSEE